MRGRERQIYGSTGSPRSRRAAFARLLTVGGLVAGLGVGWLIGQVGPGRYESNGQLLVGPIGADRSTLDAAGLLTRTYTDLLTSRTAVEGAAESLGVQVEDVEVTAVPDERSRTIRLIVESDDASISPSMANTLIRDLMVAVNDSGAQGGNEPGQVRVLDPPNDPAVQRTSLPLLVLFGSGIIGVAIGWSLGRAVTALDRTAERSGLERFGLRVVSTRLEPPRPTGRETPALAAARRSDIDDLALAQVLLECERTGPFRTIFLMGADADCDTIELARRFIEAGKRIERTIVVAPADPDDRNVQRLGTTEVILTVHELADQSSMRRMHGLADRLPEGVVLMVVAQWGCEAVKVMAAAAAADCVVVATSPGRSRRPSFDDLLDSLHSVGGQVVAVVETDARLSARPPALVAANPEGGGPRTVEGQQPVDVKSEVAETGANGHPGEHPLYQQFAKALASAQQRRRGGDDPRG